jgi:hypothetical protein
MTCVVAAKRYRYRRWVIAIWNHKKIMIKITRQHELKTIIATRQKSNDFAIVSLLHRNNCIASLIAVSPDPGSTALVILTMEFEQDTIWPYALLKSVKQIQITSTFNLPWVYLCSSWSSFHTRILHHEIKQPSVVNLPARPLHDK